MSIPFFDAAPNAEKKLSGTDNTKAQGHDTTKKTKALYSHCCQDWLKSKGGIRANSKADITTIGV